SFLFIFAICYCIIFNPHLLRIPPWVFAGLGDRFPDSVFVLDFAATIALVCGARLLVRLYYEEIRPVAEGQAPRLLILGAGNSGENVVREIMRMPELQYQVVGFLDDDAAKSGARIHGLEVFGTISRVKEVCEKQEVSEI